jgi:hypothetical protein
MYDFKFYQYGANTTNLQVFVCLDIGLKGSHPSWYYT